MSNRRGRVYQRIKGKDQPWSFIVDIGPEGGPRRQVRRSGFPKARDAQRALTELLGSQHTGTFVEPTKMTFGGYLATWLDALASRNAATTLESYRRQITCHVDGHVIAATKLQALNPLAFDALYAELLAGGRRDGKGLSARSVRFLHTILRKALGDAVRKGLLVRNPTDGASPPSAKAARSPEMKTWTGEQLRRFLDAEDGHREYPLWRVYGHTGCRRGEALGLRWEDIDLERATLSIRRSVVPIGGRATLIEGTKSDGSLRVVDLDAGTVAALRAHRKRQLEERLLVGADYVDRGFVFCSPTGAMLSPGAVTALYARRVRRHKLPVIRLHDLRHTHATLLLAAGVPAKVVTERLGHASVAFTLAKYQHVLPGMQADAAALFDRLVTIS